MGAARPANDVNDIALDERQISDFDTIAEAVTFLRNPDAEAGPEVRALCELLNLDGAAPDLRLRLRARLRNVIAERPESLRIFDAVLEPIPLKAVADSIHLSLRQLYRVRDRVLMRMAAGLRAKARLTLTSRSDYAGLQLESAARKLASGFPAEARRIALDVATSSGSLPLASRALAIAARAMIDCGEPASATAHTLGIARAKVPGERLGAAEIVTTESFGHYRAGDLTRSIEILERGLSNAPAYQPSDLHAARQRIALLHFLAVQHQEGGSNERSLQLFLEARAILAQMPDSPKAALAENLVMSAITRLAIKGQAPVAWTEAIEALRIAQWHGLGREEVWARVAIARLQISKKEIGAALASARDAVQLARCSLAGDELLRIFTTSSRIEATAGNAAEAVRRIEEGRSLVPERGFFMDTIVTAVSADLMLRSGDARGALRSAEDAIAAMEQRNHSHYIGLAYITKAEAHSAKARRIEAVEAALHYLRNGAYTSDLARALDISSHLTGNAKHAQEARELESAAQF